MRVATWNVNSVLARLPRLLPWLDERAPDVVCLQETKLSDEAFADALAAPLAERGYAYAHHGQGQWNGVALLSRAGLDDVVRGLPGEPRFPTPDAPADARAVTATCAGLRVTSVYVPNGRTPDDPHYLYKLDWLAALRASVTDPATTIVAGDMNIAPTDDDVWDPALFVASTHVTPAERKALAELTDLGLRDVVRDRWPDSRVFTYWDYRAGRFHQDLGMRIDLVLAGADPAGRAKAVWIDRKARKGKGAERPRAGDRRPGHRAGRRPGPGRAAAVGARRPAVAGRGRSRERAPADWKVGGGRDERRLRSRRWSRTPRCSCRSRSRR